MKISVIIPVLNEYRQLPVLIPLLNQLRSQVAEIIIVDGGSRDGTSEALNQAGYRTVNSCPGRAEQMNRGAELASGDCYWFLHADTRFTGPVSEYVAAIRNADSSWGRFDIRLSGNAGMFRVIEWFMNKRSALTGISTGDQGMFIQQGLFMKVGQYDAIPVMEDIAMSIKLKKTMPPMVIKRPVLMTSSRRWEEQGKIRTILLMWKMRWLYFTGVSAEKLYRLYNRQP